MNTMPNVDSVQFNSDGIPSMNEYETLYNQTNPLTPLKDAYIHQSYHKAVDQNTETCWHSSQSKVFILFYLKMLLTISCRTKSGRLFWAVYGGRYKGQKGDIIYQESL